MRKMLSIALLLCAISVTAMSQTTRPAWTQMEDFHAVMAATFHPAQDGNMQPIKTRSAELVKKATDWKASTPPTGYDKTLVNASLQKLVKGATELDKLVKVGSTTDAVLTTKLSALHDVFHEIMEKLNVEDHH